jgi:hypothetical protein
MKNDILPGVFVIINTDTGQYIKSSKEDTKDLKMAKKFTNQKNAQRFIYMNGLIQYKLKKVLSYATYFQEENENEN